MTDTTIAWTRTTFTTLWTGLAIYVIAKLGWEVDVTDPTAVLIIGLIGSVVWRVCELLSKVPYLGYVLFGINREPEYATVPPNPPVPDEDGGFVESNVVWTIVGILAIVALIIWIAANT